MVWSAIVLNTEGYSFDSRGSELAVQRSKARKELYGSDMPVAAVTHAPKSLLHFSQQGALEPLCDSPPA